MTKNHNLHFIPSIMWSLCLEKRIQSKEQPAKVALPQEPSVLEKWNPSHGYACMKGNKGVRVWEGRKFPVPILPFRSKLSLSLNTVNHVGIRMKTWLIQRCLMSFSICCTTEKSSSILLYLQNNLKPPESSPPFSTSFLIHFTFSQQKYFPNCVKSCIRR